MPKSKAAVILNVYDMAPMNSYTANLGFGIYHSGVEIYGVEFAYGGHPYPLSGIFDIVPRDVEELGEQFKFKESIRVGFTTFTLEDIRFLVNRMGEEYRGDQYHLLNKNCNHFSKHFTQILTGCSRSVPKWVNRLACASSMIPFIEKAIPTEWLTPKRLEDVIQKKDDCEAREHTASCSRGKDAAPCGCAHKKVAPPCGCSQKRDAAPCPHKKDASPCGCPDNAPSCSHKNVYSQRKDEGEQTSGCCFANLQDKSIGTARDHRCDVCGKKSGTEVYRIKHDKVEDEYTGPSKTGRSKSQ